MFMDMGAGMIIGIIVNYLTTGEPDAFFVAFGALSALAPDIDAIYHKWKAYGFRDIDRFSCLHREILHHPLLFVFLSIVITFFNASLGIIFFSSVLFHFTHDIFTAFGIPLFAPFSEWHLVINPKESPKFLIKTKKEHFEIIDKFGNDNFIKELLKPSPEFFIEIFLFGGGLVLSFFWLS